MPLTKPTIGQDPWGEALNAALDYLAAQIRAGGIAVEGADPTGVAISSAAINATIAGSEAGQVIILPAGRYLCDEPIRLRADRSYYGPGAVLVQQAGTEIDALVVIDDAEAYPRRNILWFGIGLEGDAVDPATGLQTNNAVYEAGSGWTSNRGMVLDSVQFSNFFALSIRGCGNDALTVTGSSALLFSHQGSTNHFISPYIYGNGGRGVVFGPMADDNHIFGGDIGDNNYAGAHFSGGSSSLRSCTVWGSRKSSGVIVGAPSNQIIGCQIEGHNQHGIQVLTRFASWTYIAGNKIYDNSGAGTGQYDGIYVQGDPGYLNVPGTNAAGAAPATAASVSFYPRPDYNYSGANAISFTVNDGSGAHTVTLNANYAHHAAVVSAVAAQLGTYQVAANGGYMQIARAVAGAATITVGGPDAADITGAAGSPVSYVTIVDNFIYAGIGDFYLNEAHLVDPAGGGGWYDADGNWVPGAGWVGQRHAITLDTEHQCCVVSGNNTQLIAPGAGAINNGPQPPIEVRHGGPDPTRLGVYGLKAGDTYNDVYWSVGDAEEAAWAANSAVPPGSLWWRPDTGHLKLHTGPARGRIERVLTSLNDVVGGSFMGNGAATQTVGVPDRFDTSFTVLISPSWQTTWAITAKTSGVGTSGFTVEYGTPGTGGVDYTLVRHVS